MGNHDQPDIENDLERSQKIIDRQIDALRALDDKCIDISKFTTLIIGVVITGLSIFINQGMLTNNTQHSIPIAGIILGIGLFTLCIVMTLIAYSNIAVIYGNTYNSYHMWNESNDNIREFHEQRSGILDYNSSTLERKSIRLNRAISILPSGLIITTTSVLALILNLQDTVAAIVVGVSILTSIKLSHYIWNNSYPIDDSLPRSEI